MRTWMLAALALLAATPAAGQEWLVNREQFTYIGTRLTIEVATEAEGSLQLVRGRPGIVRVAGRVPRGFAASALGTSGHLTLSAAGSGPVDYLVSVPEGVWVNVRLPDRYGTESVGGHSRMRTFEWNAAAGEEVAQGRRDRVTDGPDRRTGPRDATGEPIRGPRDERVAGAPRAPVARGPGGGFTAISDDLAPRTIALPVVGAVRTMTVRTGEDRFRVAASRPLSVQRGDPRELEIRATGEPLDLTIDIPAGTAELTLLLSGMPALTVRAGAATVACTPVTQQWLSGGRRWFTFTPGDGRWCDQDRPGTNVDTQAQ